MKTTILNLQISDFAIVAENHLVQKVYLIPSNYNDR